MLVSRQVGRDLFVLGVLLCFACPAVVAADGEFPGRKLFSKAVPVETSALKSRYGKVTIIDARSRYEYDTLHIKGALHLGLYHPAFGKKAREIQQKNGQTIVFYCNGRTCYKSYKASDKARAAGVTAEVYDAGVFEWAKAYPEQAVLLGEDLMDASKLLSKEDFTRRLLSPGEFADRVADDEEALVIDIRSVKQRRGTGLFVFKEEHIPLDAQKKLDSFIDKVRGSDKPLFVYDMAGKQVRWFQYFLESRNVDEYYFMKGGYRAFFKS